MHPGQMPGQMQAGQMHPGQMHPGQMLGGPFYSEMPGSPHPGPAFPQAGHQFIGPHTPHTGYQQPQAYGFAPVPTNHSCNHNTTSGQRHPKYDEHKYGQFMGIVNDLVNGNPDMSKMMGFLESCDTQFWKGALIGVTATLLLTNETVKKTIIDSLSGIWGIFQKEKKEE